MAVRDVFLKKEGGKDRIRKLPIVLGISAAVAAAAAYSIRTGSKGNAAATASSPVPLLPRDTREGRGGRRTPPLPPGVSSGRKMRTETAPRMRPIKRKPIVYPAPQVIRRPPGDPLSGSLPTGTAAVGRTATGIDTRDEPAPVRVLLPHGLSAGKGERRGIPKDSVLVGAASLKKGKIFIVFRSAILPDGREFKIGAYALDPDGFTPGLKGKIHGNTGLKLAAALGISVLGGISGVLADKRAVGGQIAVKETLKDAAFEGVSQSAQREAGRRLGNLDREAQRRYATLARGSALVVVLAEPFRWEVY